MGVKYHISEVITEKDWLKLSHDNPKEIIKKNIRNSYEKLYIGDLNKDISSYVTGIISALAERRKKDKFCYELCESSFAFFDSEGERYPCGSLLGKCEMGDPLISKYNSKNNEVCDKCWAKWICADCIAPIVNGTRVAPYLKKDCFKKEAYAYALETLVGFYHRDPEKFQTIIDNYYA